MTNSTKHKRETFSGRSAFIIAAIGSAVGLGNIWRFPYVTYENGGGAFIIPYVVALLTAGIPLLFLDYAIGHKYRGAAPLSFRRMTKSLETFGWWQVIINIVIGIYYAVVLGWAVMYTYYSFTSAWGSDPSSFFFKDFLRMGDAGFSLDFVGTVTGPLIAVWFVCLGLLAMGVQKGIAKSSSFFMPLLLVMFLVLVGVSLSLDGAMKGLNALFTPDWSKLLDPKVWIAAYSQIFFSLSICFGIMITYASYLNAKTDLTGSGLVVGFANSSFEVLAGIGVFAALGFIAQANGKEVSDVAASGIGLAFIAFPAIIDKAGWLVGVLFFGSLTFAALTSLISVLEVIIAAVQDKLKARRVKAVLIVGVPMMIASVLLFGTTTGLPMLDVFDNFINKFGIVAVALFSIQAIVLTNNLPQLRDHLNGISSFKLGKWWEILVGVVTPIVLSYMLLSEANDVLKNGYGGYPTWFVNTFGWGMAIGVVVISHLLSKWAWKYETVDFAKERK